MKTNHLIQSRLSYDTKYKNNNNNNNNNNIKILTVAITLLKIYKPIYIIYIPKKFHNFRFKIADI